MAERGQRGLYMTDLYGTPCNVIFDCLGQHTGIEINQGAIQESIPPLPYIVWVKDNEIVIIGKRGRPTPVDAPPEVDPGRRKAQEVPGSRWPLEDPADQKSTTARANPSTCPTCIRLKSIDGGRRES